MHLQLDFKKVLKCVRTWGTSPVAVCKSRVGTTINLPCVVHKLMTATICTAEPTCILLTSTEGIINTTVSCLLLGANVTNQF